MNLLLRRKMLMEQAPKTALLNVADISMMQIQWGRLTRPTDTDGLLYLNNPNTDEVGAYQSDVIVPPNLANTKHYISFFVQGSVRVGITKSLYGGYYLQQSRTSESLQRVSLIITKNQFYSNQNGLIFGLSPGSILKKPMILNLTQIYGAGNEPTQAEMDAIVDAHGGYWSGTINI